MADVLPLRLTASPADAAGPSPLLVDARCLAGLLAVGLRTLRAMDAAGRIPAPVRLSPGCVRWKLSEILDWIDSGCPTREVWARIRAAQK
jgi:predicted DNA-binding transcriptional regulator AlpA